VIEWIVDARADWPSITDQGPRTTCLAMAMTSSHEQATNLSLSAEYLHWASGQYPGGRGSLSAASMAIYRDGQPAEKHWPYLTDTDETAHGYGPSRTVVAPFSKRCANRYLHDVDAMIAELRLGRWPILALRMTDAFVNAAGGVVLPDGKGRAGHAVLVVGAARVTGRSLEPRLRDGERLLCVRNSWGTVWGREGHALMTETALGDCLILGFALDPTQV
jgi:hypothetical protein